MKAIRAKARLVIERLRAQRRAAVDIEFAIAGSAFIVLLLLIVQFGLFYLRVTTLDAAVQTASRQILIGNAPTQAQFAAAIQSASNGMFAGQTIYIAVQSAPLFSAITPVANISSGGGGALPYNPGTSGSDVLVQVGYTDTSLLNLLPLFVGAVSVTAAFQNEPSPT
jgi:Flp pilus assembly protein TadG